LSVESSVSKAKVEIDPFTVEIIRAGIVATTDEMKNNLMRTAYNAIVYEALDFTVALTDGQGNLISIGLGLPSFIRGISDTVKSLIAHFGSDIQPGDVLMTNDAYTHGSHLNHVICALPVFYEGEIVAFACSEPHWQDIGGLIGRPAPDIYSLGLQIPYVKVYEKGVLNKDVIDFISLNIRNPQLGLGDFRGQIACVRTGEKRVLSMVRKYGKETFKRAVELIMDQAEDFSRREIAKIPPGVYVAEHFMDDDGIDIGKHIPVKVKVVVEGDKMIVDLSEMGKQVRGGYNSRAGVSGVQMGFKTIVCPTWLPITDGSFRPLEVILPPGTVVSAERPAPIFQWMTIPMTICDSMWKALQGAIPQKIAGGHHADLAGGGAMLIDPVSGRPIVRRVQAGGLPPGGGFGAVYNADGQSATICMNDGDTHNQPVESGEAGDPTALVVRYQLREDSGGPGKFRGGLGVVREILYFRDGLVNSNIERSMDPPFGAMGAKPGKANAITVTVPKAKLSQEELATRKVLEVPREYSSYPNAQQPNAKLVAQRFPAGFSTITEVGGGGGYGNPMERDPLLVLNDVLNGYVSPGAARLEYGVAVSVERREVDAQETQRLRRGHGGPA
jgi:N-methylhydantoinase B